MSYVLYDVFFIFDYLWLDEVVKEEDEKSIGNGIDNYEDGDNERMNEVSDYDDFENESEGDIVWGVM